MMAQHSGYLDRPSRGLAEVLTSRFHAGDRIVHPKAGEGELLHHCTDDPTRGVVQFDDGLRFTVWLGDLDRSGSFKVNQRREEIVVLGGGSEPSAPDEIRDPAIDAGRVSAPAGMPAQQPPGE